MATSLTEDARSGVIQASFSPRIAVFASEDVDEACRKNNLPSFVSLLRPFEYIDRVSVRHSNYSTAIMDSFRLSFLPASWFSGEESSPDEDKWIANTLDQSIFTKHNISNWLKSSSSKAPSQPQPRSIVTPNFRIKKENEWLGSEAEENEEYPQPSTPWYIAFLTSLLEHRPLVDHDHTSHPLAALVVVSTNNAEPLNEFAKLYEKSGKGGSGWPRKEWLETGTILRYYLLVHEINEEPDGGKGGANELLDSVKRAYGLNCGLLCINSERTEWLRKKRLVDRDPHFVYSDEQVKKEDHWWKYRFEISDSAEDKEVRFGEFMSAEDVLGLKILLRQFTLQSLVPHMERCVQHWNDSLAASRKGITGRLFSVGKKYFSKSPAPGSSSPTTSSSQFSYNPINSSYPHQSQEAQTRRLADFSFMLGDYKLASQMYDYVRKDAQSDKAWSYCSSATQMIGLCTLLQSSSNQRSKLNVDLQYFLFDHSEAVNLVRQLRMVMIYHEMAKAVGNSNLMASSLIRIATSCNHLISGLVYEQVSRIASSRQATLHTVLAAHQYDLAQQKWLADICFKQCPQLCGWDRIEDHLDERIGQIAESESDWSVATQKYWNILRRRIEARLPPGESEDDEICMTRYRTALKKRSSEANSMAYSPNTDFIKLVDVERSGIRVPQQQRHLKSYPGVDARVWDRLISRYPDGSISMTASVGMSIAIVNEPFYLDLAIKNPIGADVNLSDISIKVISLGGSDGSDGLSENSIVQLEPLEDLVLSPYEDRQIPLKLTCTRPTAKFEITHISYKFDSLIDCSQALKKKGKRLQSTLSERLGKVYSNDLSMQVQVREEVPIFELIGSENLVKEIYAGESLMAKITIQNVGKVKMKNLACVISHESFFSISSSTKLGGEKGNTIYESTQASCEPLVIETPNDLVNDAPALLANELDINETIECSVVCRGEEIGHHTTCWLFVFQHATTGEFMTFGHIQPLTVFPSLEIKPVIRPGVTKDAFYLLSVQIDNVGIEEGVDIYQASTMGAQWSSKCIHIDADSSKLVNVAGGSRFTTLAFELHPWRDAQEDLTTPVMLRHLEKVLKKEQLVEKENMPSIQALVCSTRPPGLPAIRVDSPTFLSTILSSHRNLRCKALQSHFTALTMPNISRMFPLYSTRSVDLLLFWKTCKSGRYGHHYISDLKFGATTDVVGRTLEVVKGKAGGMYQESQREQKLLIKQWQTSEYGTWQDPIVVDVHTSSEFMQWDFESNGPLTVRVKFVMKNLSTLMAAKFKLSLVREMSGTDTSLSSLTTTGWVGKLTHVGELSRLGRSELECDCWFFGPGVMDVGRWECESTYELAEGQAVEKQPKPPVWRKVGTQTCISVAGVSQAQQSGL